MHDIEKSCYGRDPRNIQFLKERPVRREDLSSQPPCLAVALAKADRDPNGSLHGAVGIIESGAEFIEQGGVRHRPQEITILEGDGKVIPIETALLKASHVRK